MKKLVRDFFDVPATERRGVLALVMLILLIQSFRLLYPMMLSETYPLTEAEAKQFAEWIIRHDTSLRMEIKAVAEPSGLIIPNQVFNPNTMNLQEWQKLGFSQKEAASALKFIQKGGKFLKRSDLQKLYFIDSAEYRALEPWIDLPITLKTNFTHNKPPKAANQAKPLSRIELNSADTLKLQQLRGIGPYWARRIVRQRERLGGFCKIEQLLEMKGMPDSLYQLVYPQVYIDTGLIQKIRINHVSDEDLLKHPYCWYGVGKSIVNYRAKHGVFHHADDMRKIIALKPEQLERLLPYLTFE